MKKIKLTGKYGKDKYTLVDAIDFTKINKYSWTLDQNGYVRRTEWEVGKTHKTRKATIFYLHRVIMNPKKRVVVDHINQNPLDNRRSNLRIATHGQNHLNQGLQKNNTSGYKGVVRKRSKWQSQIKFNGNMIRLGLFENIKDAAKTYNTAALKYFGEFALLNKV